ncbi:MAG TPA: hypothetical protein VD864_03355, partial [Nocardioides sp.]|nr:hypothetical protein [Nocardioides sp.]
MSRPSTRTPRALLRRALVAATSGVLAATTVAVLGTGGPADAGSTGTTPVAASAATSAASIARRAGNVVTPGDFVGYGFDQCHTPEQWKMDRWLQSSP